MEFKDRFKKLRLESGLTQEELAEKIGLSKTAVSAYERGVSKPRFDAIDSLAEFFNVSINYLLGNTNERSPYPKMTEEEQNRLGAEDSLDFDMMFKHGSFFVENTDQRNKKLDSGYQQIEVTPQEYRLVMALRLMNPSKRDAVFSQILSE